MNRGSPRWGDAWLFFKWHKEKFYERYHKRSNAETVFHMLKSKFGSSVKSKTKTAQFNEVLCKVLCHNICVMIQEMHEMGVHPFKEIKGLVKPDSGLYG